MSTADTLQAHDKQIGMIASSVESLIKSTERTNDKIDDIYKAVNKQAILAEKMFNLEATTSGNFVRINQKLHDIEEVINNDIGCAVSRFEKQRLDTAVANLIKISSKVDTVETAQQSKLSSKVAYTVFVLLLGYLITFGVYVEQYLNKLDRGIIRNENAISYDKYTRSLTAPSYTLKEAK
jgi:hypothetical protein